MAWDPLASVGRMLTNLGNWLAAQTALTFIHLARLDASVLKAGFDVHDISLASGRADVLGYEVSPANVQWNVQTDHVFAQPHVRSLRAVA